MTQRPTPSNPLELTECPHCKANLVGSEIPEKYRHQFGATHGSRLIAKYSRRFDMTAYYECPDCGGAIDRGKVRAMSKDRKAEVPSMVKIILGRRARWAPVHSIMHAYDGHERTLQVFDTPAAEQLGALEQLEPHRSSLEEAAGGALVVMFYSPAQSPRHL